MPISNAAELGLTIQSERAAGYRDFTGFSETIPEFIQMRAEEDVDAAPSGTSSAPSRLEIRMRGEGVLVHWEATATERVTAFPTLASSVLALSRLGNWRDDWIIVTDVLHARGGIVLISGVGESHVTLHTTGPVIETSPLTAINDPSVQVIEQSGMHLSILMREEFTPCFKASRVRRRLLRTSREFVPVSVPR